ncbi:DUF5753 domain-containing protein [Amycolatopsis marina]|uniref:DUF5753 domain-containing protein n=1 Tax=Amycolatopsis marina TaxID=490629 RepID=UPI002481EE2E|nr:DUF5753 domain-containing protein [Amycolatopsis marina]
MNLRVHARLARQHILRSQYGPACVFYIREHALRSVVGNVRVMHEQLMHLLMNDSRPQCSVRVIPDAVGPIGSLGGMFRVMDYADHPPVAYAEVRTAALFMEEPEDVAQYRDVIRLLDNLALKGGQSREWLARLASQYNRAEARRYDHSRPPRSDLA